MIITQIFSTWLRGQTYLNNINCVSLTRYLLVGSLLVRPTIMCYKCEQVVNDKYCIQTKLLRPLLLRDLQVVNWSGNYHSDWKIHKHYIYTIQYSYFCLTFYYSECDEMSTTVIHDEDTQFSTISDISMIYLHFKILT